MHNSTPHDLLASMLNIIPVLDAKMMDEAKIADNAKRHMDDAIADLSKAGAELDKLLRPLNNDDFIRMGKLAMIVHIKTKQHKDKGQQCQDTRNMMIKACIHRDELQSRIETLANRKR